MTKVLKISSAALLLYLFFVSIQLMGDAFKLFGVGFAEALIRETSNPFVGLVIGILATSIAQSSSLTTSITVGMVAGGALTMETAIPIVFGANIGTSVTSIVVSIAHINRSNEFKRAFAASTVHDFFNVLAVLIIFPFQLLTNFLGYFVEWFASMSVGGADVTFHSPIKAIVKPFAHLILELTGKQPIIALILALLILFFSLRYLMNIMRGVILTRLERFFGKYIFKTPIRAILFGIIVTASVQSSSITISVAVPLAAAGVLTLEQIFPYTMGANITALMAAAATGSVPALAVGLAHLIFNLMASIIIWPIRFIPLWAARNIADLSIRNQLIPVGYVLFAFFLLPILLIYIFR